MTCDCKENVWKIGPYLDGELPLGEREALEKSLRECPECRRLLDSFRGLDSVCARDTVPAVGATEWARVLEGAQRGDPRIVPMRRRRALDVLVPFAAAAALVVAGLFLAFRDGDDAGANRSERASAVEERGPADSVETLDPKRSTLVEPETTDETLPLEDR